MDNKDLQSNKLPQIDIKDKNLPVITKRAWDALIASNSPPYLFTFGNTAVRLVTGENGQIFTDRLGKNKLRHELARCAIFRTIKKGELEIDLPPLYVVNDLLAHPNYPLPRLSRIVNAPIFSKEGKLHLTPGYSPSTECYFNLDERVQIPKVPMIPSEGDVKRAKGTIAEIQCDFPFISESEIANAISLYLSRFVCGMISGPSPVYVIEASSPGNGKTLLAQGLAYPSTGKIIEAMSEGRNDEEMRKRITAKLINSPNFVFIDNVRNQIAYSSLAAAITAGVWEDRILGVSRTVRVPVTSTWVITGNNPSLSSEMARRCVRIRIDTVVSNPGCVTPVSLNTQIFCNG